MKTPYNKFSNYDSNKLGKELRILSNLSNTMKAGISSAIPIWEILGLTEDQYHIYIKASPLFKMILLIIQFQFSWYI